jgi:hypothetical protein
MVLMKALLLIVVALALTACGQSDSENSNQAAGKADTSAAMDVTQLDLSKLPATVTVMLELDPAVEEGYDAFGNFINDGQDVTIGVSSGVAKAGGINVGQEFKGKVKITISGEHDVSRQLYRVYSVSSIEKM